MRDNTDVAEFTDGLGRIERWERAVADPMTWEIILQRVVEEGDLKAICKSRGWPYSIVGPWIAKDEERNAAYENALGLWGDALGQETVAISDEQALAYSKQGIPFDPDVPRDSLRVKARQWVAGKLLRKRWGEQQDVKHSGSIGLSLMSVLATLPRASADRQLAAEKDVTQSAVPVTHEMI